METQAYYHLESRLLRYLLDFAEELNRSLPSDIPNELQRRQTLTQIGALAHNLIRQSKQESMQLVSDDDWSSPSLENCPVTGCNRRRTKQ